MFVILLLLIPFLKIQNQVSSLDLFMEVGNTSPVWGEFTNNCINIGTHPISLYLTLRVTIC